MGDFKIETETKRKAVELHTEELSVAGEHHSRIAGTEGVLPAPSRLHETSEFEVYVPKTPVRDSADATHSKLQSAIKPAMVSADLRARLLAGAPAKKPEIAVPVHANLDRPASERVYHRMGATATRLVGEFSAAVDGARFYELPFEAAKGQLAKTVRENATAQVVSAFIERVGFDNYVDALLDGRNSRLDAGQVLGALVEKSLTADKVSSAPKTPLITQMQAERALAALRKHMSGFDVFMGATQPGVINPLPFLHNYGHSIALARTSDGHFGVSVSKAAFRGNSQAFSETVDAVRTQLDHEGFVNIPVSVGK